MSTKSTSASTHLHAFNEAVDNLKTAHEAIEWCTFLFQTICERSKFDFSDTAAVLMARLAEIQKSSSIGRYLSTEFEGFIHGKITEAKAALDEASQARAPEGRGAS